MEDLGWLWNLLMLANAGVVFCNVIVWVMWVFSRYAEWGFGSHPEAIFPHRRMYQTTVFFARLSRDALRKSTEGLTWEAVRKNGVGLGVRKVVFALFNVAWGCLHILCAVVCMVTMPFVYIMVAAGLVMVANLFLLFTGVDALLLQQGRRRAAAAPPPDDAVDAGDEPGPDAGADGSPAEVPSVFAAVAAVADHPLTDKGKGDGGMDSPAPRGPATGGTPSVSKATGPEALAAEPTQMPQVAAQIPQKVRRIVAAKRAPAQKGRHTVAVPLVLRAASPARRKADSKRQNSADFFEGTPEVSPTKRGAHRRGSNHSRGDAMVM